VAQVLIFAVILLSFTEGIDWGQAWQGLQSGTIIGSNS
jgi:hypothetical protein